MNELYQNAFRLPTEISKRDNIVLDMFSNKGHVSQFIIHQRECEFFLVSDMCFITGFEIFRKFSHGCKCIFSCDTLVKVLLVVV